MLRIMIDQTCITFLLMGLGYICRKKNIFDLTVQKGLANMVLTVALPCKLISSANIEIANIGVGRIFTFCAISFLYFLSQLLIFTNLARRLPLTEDLKKQIPILIVFPSSAFMGIPIAAALYQEAGVFLMGLFSIFYSMFQYTYGIGIYTGLKKDNFIQLLKNPLLIASLFMIVLFSFQIKLPNVIQSTVSIVGAMSVPLSMFVVGGTISQYPLTQLLRGKKQYIVSFVRLLLIPLLSIMIFKMAGVDDMVSIILSLVFALPASSTSAVIADKYSGNSVFPSLCVAQTMLLFLVTMPLITMIVNRLWVY